METFAIKRTPLYDRHVALGGKLVDFAGWALPVYYSSILEEHQWVREHCGYFDVSHLGEIRVHGLQAKEHLQRRLTNDLRKLSDGGLQYHLILNEQGGAIDDLLVYQGSEEDLYVIANASNVSRVCSELQKGASAALVVEDVSDRTGCIAVQGPDSPRVMSEALGLDVSKLTYYHFVERPFAGSPVWISRSGYTGEDGFEIFGAEPAIRGVWQALEERGARSGARPAGLGARDTLRLEAGNPLYGHELDPETTPLEAGLGFAVSFEKGEFTGRSALLRQKEIGPSKKLVGFKMLDRAIAREGYSVLRDGKAVGRVTSGSYGPSVKANIGMAYIEAGLARNGEPVDIDIRGRACPAEIVRRPFVPLRHK